MCTEFIINSIRSRLFSCNTPSFVSLPFFFWLPFYVHLLEIMDSSKLWEILHCYFNAYIMLSNLLLIYTNYIAYNMTINRQRNHYISITFEESLLRSLGVQGEGEGVLVLARG